MAKPTPRFEAAKDFVARFPAELVRLLDEEAEQLRKSGLGIRFPGSDDVLPPSRVTVLIRIVYRYYRVSGSRILKRRVDKAGRRRDY